MQKKEAVRYAWAGNRIMLGLLMLLPGLFKLFVMKPSTITGMLSGLGFAAPAFFAWTLILAEIVSGVLILLDWRLKYTIIAPIVILLIAAFTAHWQPTPNYPLILLHFVAISNYIMLGIDVHGSQA